MKQRDEEELRIGDENRRLKEWEKNFDQEQKIKEEELLQKFYTGQSKDQKKEEADESPITDIETNDSKKNN